MKSLVTLVILFFITVNVFAQEVNYRLKEIADEKAENLSLKLELSHAEKKELANILYDSNIELSKAVSSSVQFKSKIEQIKKDKNQKLLKLFGENRYNLYFAFEEMELANLDEMYIDLFNEVSSNQEYLSKVLDYRFQYILPVLSKCHRAYTNNMTVKDFYSFKNIREKYYLYYDKIKSNGNSKNYFYDYLTDADRFIFRTLSLKYDEVLEEQIKNIDAFNQKWTNDLDAITAEYYSDNLIESIQKIEQFKAITSLKRRMLRLHFMMLMPGDKDHYIKNLDIISNEEKHFEKIINELN